MSSATTHAINSGRGQGIGRATIQDSSHSIARDAGRKMSTQDGADHEQDQEVAEVDADGGHHDQTIHLREK